MAVKTVDLPLIVIVGPTASGKTSLAIKIARQFSGEIICADSRTIYKGMDIGTAKPTSQEQADVPHWGIDLVEPGEYFSAADFKQYALQKIDEIRARGRIPLLVGGTGLYVDAIIFDYTFGPPASQAKRRKLANLTLEQLYDYCYKHNVKLPENNKNKRYIIHAIEQNGSTSAINRIPMPESIIVGISTDRDVLRTRIRARSEQLFDDSVVEEATLLGKRYGWNSEAMTGNIYPLVHLYLKGELSLEEVKIKFTTLDWRLAKRQLTWLRRNPFIHWGDIHELQKYIADALANKD